MAESYRERYGVADMTIEEELKLLETSPNLAKSRSAKIRLGDAFAQMKELAERMQNYSKHIPEEDNDRHTALMVQFAERMEKLYADLDMKIYIAIYHPENY